MKRIMVIMALFSLWCSTSVLASFPYAPMDGHYTVTTQVTPLEDGFSRYDYAVTNVDQGPEPDYPWVGLDCFVIQVPSAAIVRNIISPAISTSDPCLPGGRNGYWLYTIDTYDLLGPEPWGIEGWLESGYKWLAWSGQDTVYPQGTTAHFIFEVNAPPGSNLFAITYLGTGDWGNYTYKAFGKVTSPVTLELLYPVGPSPKVFTRGWLFGAKCLDASGQDVSDQVEWSGTGSFQPATGSQSRPTFGGAGSNTITLTYTVGGETVKKDFTVEAVSPDNYARVGSLAHCPADVHHCQACPHNVYGPVISGSPTVSIDGRPAARKGDPGRHGHCCGPNTFVIGAGDPDVLIDGNPAARIGDRTNHCGGVGKLITSVPAGATQAVQSLLLMQ